MKNFYQSTLTSVWISTLALALLGSGCASSSGQLKPLTKKDHYTLLLELAAANIAENDPTQALISLNQAREINDSESDLYYLYALTYYQKHETRLATESARRSVQLDPKSSKSKNTLGKLLLDQGKLAEAEKPLKEAASDLTYKEAYLAKTNLGIVYYKKTQLSDAEFWLNKAIEEGGEGACMALYYRGEVYSQKNQLALADKDFRRASRNSCSSFTDAHLAEGKTLMRLKKYDQARAKFIELQQLFPETEAATQATTYLKEIP